MTERLKVERLGTVEQLNALSDKWEALDAATFPRTPFSGPTWNLLWWKHFRESRPLVRDRFFVHAVWDEAGQLRAIAPLMITEQPSMGPLRTRRLQFWGSDANVTEIRGVVCRPADEKAVVAALAAELRRAAKDWDFMKWGGLRDDSALSDERRISKSREITDFFLQPGTDWEAFKSALPRNVKESLRKCYNAPKRDGHTLTFRVIERESEVPGAVEAFFRLHAARSKAEETITHADVFYSDHVRAFLSEYACAMASRGQTRIFQTLIADEVVATRVGFALGDNLYLYFSGFSPDWGRYSVMTTTVAEALKYAMGAGFSTINLSPGVDVSKTRWRPLEIVLRESTWVSPSWRGPATFRVFQAIDGARKDPRFSRWLGVLRRRV